MSSIIRETDTYHGISVDGRGVFTNDKYGYVRTYAGQCKDGHACGLGVATHSSGSKGYTEHGPDGQYDGRFLGRDADGHTEYGRRGHRGAHPFSCRRWWLCDTTRQQPHAKHVRAATCASDRFAVEAAREAPSCTLTTAALCTRSVRCHAIVQHTAC